MNRPILFLLILAALLVSCAYADIFPPPASSAQPTPLPPGTVLFQDDFSSPATGWDRIRVNEGIMDYHGGGYRILVNAPQVNFWAAPRRNFSDVRIEVDIGKLGGPDENRIGLLCRLSGDNYYFFIISSDGYYGIGIFFNGQAILLGQSEMLPSEHIQRGLAVNHLRADCAGDTLTFYVNGFQVAQAQNDALSSGDIGILAGSFDTPGVDVIFDNFAAFQP